MLEGVRVLRRRWIVRWQNCSACRQRPVHPVPPRLGRLPSFNASAVQRLWFLQQELAMSQMSPVSWDERLTTRMLQKTRAQCWSCARN